MKVLIVEDNKQHEHTIVSALQLAPTEELSGSLDQRGLAFPCLQDEEISVARHYEAAMEEFQKPVVYDLLILDLYIPRDGTMSLPNDPTELYGMEILKQARRLEYYLPVVVLSAYVDPGFAGSQQHLLLLEARETPGPDEILFKGRTGQRGCLDDINSLQRKLAPFLVDLTDEDIKRLKEHRFHIPEQGNTTRRVLRQLKRLARSAPSGKPLPDILLLGENGVGKTKFAEAYHLFRPPVPQRLRFFHEDLGSLDVAGSAPSIRLFGATDFAAGTDAAWSLGAFARCTCYRRASNQVWFETQELEEGSPQPRFIPLGPRQYPDEGYAIDFDASGTLFLDEVLNIEPDIQKMLLQAIGYDLEKRHVYTTGRVTRKVPVGPALVLATRKDINDALREAEETKGQRWLGTLDYLYRIDQIRVTIPPLRDRREEVTELLQGLVEQRTGIQNIPIDATVQPLFERLQFKNNVADLRRIADQVTPEDKFITWRHIRAVYERENPIVMHTAGAPTVAWTRKDCADYLQSVRDGQKSPLSLPKIEDQFNKLSAYRMGLYFAEYCRVENTKTWPAKAAIRQMFNMTPRAFQMQMKRYRPGHSPGDRFTLNDLIEDIRKFREGEL